jgi:hypothetical protein
MAAASFQGTLGQFSSYNQFGNLGSHSPAARQAQALGQNAPPVGANNLPSQAPQASTNLPSNNVALGTSGYNGLNDAQKTKDFA